MARRPIYNIVSKMAELSINKMAWLITIRHDYHTHENRGGTLKPHKPYIKVNR